MNIEQYAVDFLERAEEMLHTCGRPGICAKLLHPGSVTTWDWCAPCDSDDCGMLWVRVDSSFTYRSFPSAEAAVNCVLPTAYRLELGLLRCAPMPDEDGSPPDPDALTEASLQLLLDRRALLTAARDHPSRMLVAVSDWSALGPQGG